MLKRWRDWAGKLKRQTFALYLACRDPRVPWYAKALGALVVAYALSPVDLIPDFIPVLGYLDDLILLPLGIALVIRLIPQEIMQECHARATAEFALGRTKTKTAAVVVILAWVIVFFLVAIVVLRKVVH